jgi:LCP family protein required for cell wall assembly
MTYDPTRRIPVEDGRAVPRRAAAGNRAGGNRAPDAPPGAGVRAGRSGSGREVLPSALREPDGPRRPGGGAGRTVRPRRRIRLRWVVLGVVLVLLAYPLALGLVAWRNLGRIDALPADTAATPGRTYLVVGSDSRRGLTAAQRRKLNTGNAEGQRTDTIMLLHVPAGGSTVLMSVPRDSYVDIPGKGKNKINAAFAIGGPKLLAQTLEKATGVQIDDYVEIGFGGFAAMVDAVKGVQICPKRAMDDPKAGIDLKKGCQQADGAVALGYARARYSDPRGDFGRVERQREVLGSIVAKGTRPGTLLNPFRSFPLASSGGGSLTVDDQTGPIALARFVLGMKSVAAGKAISLTVPVDGVGSRPGAGSVVLWDDSQADQVFSALRRSRTESIRVIADEQEKAIPG